MDDAKVWALEKSLWTGDTGTYRALIAEDCLMVVPAHPYILTGREAADAMAKTPRWREVDLRDGRIMRPEEGLIVIAYTVEARRDAGDAYVAYCTSTYRRLGYEEWQVIQHQQTPPCPAAAEGFARTLARPEAQSGSEVAGAAGIEPATYGFGDRRSTS
jgi:Domain of unknown function (DUF4440)